MRSFEQGTRELEEMVGRGDLVMKVEVSQAYAAPQHAGYWVTGPLAGHVIKHHPRGGQSHYLSEPLFAHAPEYMRLLAAQMLQRDGLIRAAREVVESLSREVFDKAPREFEDLRNSAHPTVTDNHEVVYDRPPVRGRLSKSALREKGRRRRAGEGGTARQAVTR
jgi:hypothetical protein